MINERDSRISEARRGVQELKAHKSVLLSQKKALLGKITEGESQLESGKKAQKVIQDVAQMTQKQLEYHVSELVTLALSGVFENPYDLIVDFVQKRNKTEAELLFEREGERVSPLDASGGGAVDVAAFALRVSLWSLRSKKTRRTLILDEPFKHLSSELQPRAGEMLKEISQKLGIQIIMVSHNQDLIGIGDKAFEVTIKAGISKVTEL